MGCLPALHLPQPDGAIKPFAGKVRQLLGELQLDVDARKAFLEQRQRRPQPQTSKAESRGQPYQAARFGLALLKLGLKRSEALQQHQCPLINGFALGRGG